MTRTVKGMVAPSLGLALLLVACRGLVGIEDLGLDAGTDAATGTDGSTPTDGSTTDGSTTKDATSDAASDGSTPEGGPPPPPGDCTTEIASCSSQGLQCRKCCKDGCGAFHSELDDLQATRTCICAACSQQCAGDTYCTTTTGAPATPTCGGCIDQTYKNGQCSTTCTSTACQAGLTCLKNCP